MSKKGYLSFNIIARVPFNEVDLNQIFLRILIGTIITSSIFRYRVTVIESLT